MRRVILAVLLSVVVGQSTTAIRVYGQLGRFNTTGSGGFSVDSLSQPAGVFATTDGVFVADRIAHRVLFFQGADTTPSRVYGQGGSFVTGFPNKGGISADSLFSPNSVFVDASGVYIADTSNNRVLFYPGSSTTAIRVYGQADCGSGVANKGASASDTSLSGPLGIFSDASGVYIADSDNNRVLYYPGTSTTAIRVYGQGSFFTGTGNTGGLSAVSLFTPTSVFVDGTGAFIVDSVNNRVLFYSGNSTNATRVYGQEGSFITGISNIGSSVNADGLSLPKGVFTSSDGIYITDSGNNRILFFNGSSTTATRVYGQGGSFMSGNVNNGIGVSAGSLYQPDGVFADANGLYVADQNNNRALFFSGPLATTTVSSTQSSTTVTLSIISITASPLTVTTPAATTTVSSVSTTTVASPLVVSQILTTNGNLTLTSGGLTVLPGGFLNVRGLLTLSGPLLVVVDITSGSISVPIYRSGVVAGQFSSVMATTSSSSLPSCSIVTAAPNQSGGTLSVAVSVDSSGCDGGLSTGVIVGVAIGAVAGAVLFVVAIVLLSRYLLARRDMQANASLRGDQLHDLNRAV